MRQTSKGKNSPNIGRDLINSKIGDTYITPPGKASLEVKTIMSLIEAIDKNAEKTKPREDADKDLDKKLRERFSAQLPEITKIYVDHHTTYGSAYHVAREHSELSELTANRLATHLKTESNKALRASSGNPLKAIEIIVEELTGLIGKHIEDGKDYSKGAIRLFVLEELIRCNVFPNP